MELDITPSLDVLVRELRDNPSRQTLQRATYYLTTVKNEHNVVLLVNEILHSELLPSPCPDSESALHVLEAIRAAGHRKTVITDPTIWPERWADLVLWACQGLEPTLDSWRAVPALAGLIGSEMLTNKQSDRAQRMFVDLINKNIINNQHGKHSLLVIALVRCTPVLTNYYFGAVDNHAMLLATAELLYQNNAPRMKCMKSLELDHLSEFSHCIKRLIENVSNWDVLDQTLNHIIRFVDRIAELPLLDWPLLKSCLFGLSVQLQGFASLLLQNVRVGPYFAAKILQSMSPIYFIVLHLSTSGFAAFDFVYYACLDVLLKDPVKVDEVAVLLRGRCNPGMFNELVTRGKLVYMLNFYEQVVTIVQKPTLAMILNLARDFLTPKTTDYEYIQPVLESAHSVVLASLTAVPDDQLILEYFETSLDLFPHVLSAGQLRLAVSTLIQVVTTPAYRMEKNEAMARIVKERLFSKCQVTKPGQSVPAKEGEEQETTRVVLASLLINAVPYCMTAHELEAQLESASRLIRTSTPEERTVLQKNLWQVISSDMSLDLVNVAINWWYSSPRL